MRAFFAFFCGIATLLAWAVTNAAFDLPPWGRPVGISAVASVLGVLGGIAVCSLMTPDVPTFGLWRANRRRMRAVHERAAVFISAGLDPREALGRASAELTREALEALE